MLGPLVHGRAVNPDRAVSLDRAVKAVAGVEVQHQTVAAVAAAVVAVVQTVAEVEAHGRVRLDPMHPDRDHDQPAVGPVRTVDQLHRVDLAAEVTPNKLHLIKFSDMLKRNVNFHETPFSGLT